MDTQDNKAGRESKKIAKSAPPPAPVSPEVEVADAPQTVTEQPVEQQAPTMPVLAVWFDFIRADATRGQDRVYIQGVFDIRYRAQLEHFEQMILQQSQGQFVKVQITNWKSLEG